MEERIAAIEVLRLAISELKPHPRNPRSHPKPGSPLWKVAEESLEHDYFDPVIWNRRNGMLVGGHFRTKILEAKGFTHVDVSVVDYDEATHWARMIAANRPFGEFEEGLLASLASDIELAGLSAALAGFDNKAMLAMIEGPAVSDDTEEAEVLVSKAEELQAEWKVQLGDLYQAGPHRLLCGDCASLDNWELLLNGCAADMVWTDPPYNIAYEEVQQRRNQLRREGGGKARTKPQAILNDDVTAAEYDQLLKAWFTTAFTMVKPGGAVYIAHADCFGLETRLAARDAGFKIAQTIIWAKNGFTLGRQDYQWQHEPILYGWKPGAAHHWQGGYRQSTVIDAKAEELKKKSKAELLVIVNEMLNSSDGTLVREARSPASTLHPTVKPLPLVARQIWNSSKRGETVLELFGGSGTTLAAAEQTGRKCVATELEPKYCAVILERLKSMGLAIEKVRG